MRARLLGALPALLTAATMVVAPTAHAQTPTPSPTATATASQTPPAPTASPPAATPTPTPTATPTPTVTPTPTPDPEDEKKARLRERTVVKRVYRDYRQDGEINSCKHSRKALRRTLESISDEFDADFPDFKPAVKAAIKDWDKERCEQEEAEAEATPTPTTPPSTSTPAPTTTPAPPPSTSDTLPDLDDDNDNDGSGAIPPSNTPSPPSEGDVQPVQPTTTPVPTPTPTPPAEAELVVTRPEAQDANLMVPAILLAAALLGLAGAGATAIYARRTGRLGSWGDAWREASYRAAGAWGDFSDWLRVGR
jgi:hypothetical protein